MPGPYDIYDDSSRRGPKYLPDLSPFFASPVGIGAWLATDLFFTNKYLSRSGLMRSVSQPGLRRFLLNDVKQMTGGVSPAHFRGYMTGLNDAKFKGRWKAEFGEMFGKTAARRVGIGKIANSFSRFAMWYGLVEVGLAVGGMLGDAISAYQPPEYVNKRRQIETGGAFVDTRYAQSQRQRAIQAIHNTQLSTRAALGNEASFVHLER